MSILRDDKMRPLFQEVIVTKLAVTQSTTRYQMKATDIIFPPMSLCESQDSDTTALQSWAYFPRKPKQ